MSPSPLAATARKPRVWRAPLALLLLCLGLLGACKEKTSVPTAKPSAAAQPDAQQGTAAQPITQEELPRVASKGEETHAGKQATVLYHVDVVATEDGSTRARIELNDLTDDEMMAIRKERESFLAGDVLVPPTAPFISKRMRERTTYTVLQEGGEPITSTLVAFTYYEGAGEDHFIAVTKPEKPLKMEALTLATPEAGFAAGARIEKIAPKAPSEAALKAIHAYLKERLLPEELSALPAALTAEHVTFAKDLALGPHAGIAAVKVVPKAREYPDEPMLTALLLLNERDEVSGMVESPALRIDYFTLASSVKTSAEARPTLLYESDYYEGHYMMLLRFDDTGKPLIVMMAGDGA